MPALKATYPSQDDIPEGLADYYKEMADGKFKLNLDGEFKTEEDVKRVKKALKDAREENEDLQRKLSNYPDDFDPDRWDRVKDMDPDDYEPGELGEDAEKEIQKRVAEQVREKERKLKEEQEEVLEKKKQELEEQKQAILRKHKVNWIKQQLAEKHGFNDPKRLRWFMQDVQNGVLPDIRRAIENIEVVDENGEPKIVGGDLKDPDGAIEILEKIAEKEQLKDYKPAGNNRGGDAGNEGSEDSGTQKLKKEDGSLNLTVASQMWKEDKEKAKRKMRAAGFDPDKYF